VRRLSLLLLFLALAACGGGDGESVNSSSPESSLAQAAAKTEGAGSSRLSFEARMSGGGLPQRIRFSGEGEFDYETRSGRATYDMSELFPGGGSIEIVMDGLVMYMHLPPELGALLTAGKPWLKLDLDELGEQAGVDLGALDQMNQGDPAQMLLYLRGASDEIREVGEEKIRGVETTHLRATVDLRKAVERSADTLPAEAREGARASIERLIDMMGADTVPVDVWIDGDGLARRMRMAYDLEVAGASERLRFELDFELYDFGVDVDAEPPPAGEVAELSELVGGGG
jgi:hypothetical protein